MKKEKSIPSILGVILLLICLIAGVFLSSQKTFFSSKASSDCRPVNVQITNITHRSASVSFTSTATCTSTLNINNLTYENKLSSEPSQIHYFEINNLSDQKEFTFSLIVGGQVYTGNEYTFLTAVKPNSPIPNSNLAWGKVFTPEHQPAVNTIVYLNIPGASPLSSYTTSEGNWNVSLANSFNETKTNWFSTPDPPVSEDIFVISQNGLVTQISHISSRNNPVPDIIIGKNSLDAGLDLPDTGALPTQPQHLGSGPVNLTLTNPLSNDVIKTPQPQFFGTASPNSTIVIEVHSDQVISGQSIADQSGSWNWTPPSNLTPGSHSVTVKTYNQNTGLWDTITRNFTVLATSGGPDFTATPSATIAITPTIVLPTITPVPTLVIPTNTPQPRTAIISTSSGTPVTGNSAPTIILLFLSATLIIYSLSLFISKSKIW